MTEFIPKITLEGFSSDEPFIKFTQNGEWTSSNFCLHVNNGYTNLNGLIINGFDTNDTFYTSNKNLNMSFNVTGNSNIIFKTNNTERLRISNTGNVGIGASTLDYKLNVAGTINSTLIYKSGIELDNIYLLIKNNYWLLKNSGTNNNILYTDPGSNIDKIGIGNTEPLGYLHLGTASTNNNSDANIIITKKNNNNNRNFKFGYDENFNFTFGDFGDTSAQSWKKQFYINSIAPENSLMINNAGNIGIGTSAPGAFKVNINGSLNATSLRGDGFELTNLDYNKIITGKPDLINLNNWIINTNKFFIYNNPIDYKIGIGYTSDPNSGSDTQTYRLAVNGNIYSKTGFFIDGVNINNIYVSITDANSRYVTSTIFNASQIWQFDATSLTISLINVRVNWKIILGNSTTSLGKASLLDVKGTINSEYFIGDGNGITNIDWNNITQNVPSYLLKTEATVLYYTKTYLDNTYVGNILTIVGQSYTTLTKFNLLEKRMDEVYSSIDLTAVAENISNLAVEGKLVIYYSNIQQVPYSYSNIQNKDKYGFNTPYLTDEIINIGGGLKAEYIKSIGTIYENNTSLSNLYISSNSYHTSISNYDKIIDRIKSQFTSEKIYPPSLSTSLFNTYSISISNALYGNGIYDIQSSTNFLILSQNNNTNFIYENAPASNLFNYNNLSEPWTTGTDFKYNLTSEYNITPLPFNSSTVGLQNILYTRINSTKIYAGHWILLYYSEKIVASKIDIIIKDSDLNAPKKITLLGTNDIVSITSGYLGNYTNQQINNPNWDILIDNYVIPSYTQTQILTTSFYTTTINIENNSKAYNYYKLIITNLVGSQILKIQQLKLYAFENKKEWTHSGNNIYSLSNISIGTINDLSPYILNVNGHIYSSSNIYANSNIGIGNTAPLGNLHIASPAINSDGTLIISKKDNINNRNFKFGYDENFNFTFGDFGNASTPTPSWTKQFYINSNAPENSLMINRLGNIGIGTNNTSLNQKLIVNGNTTISGSINQSDNGTSNIFNSYIYTSNNIYILSNLYVNSNIYASNNIFISSNLNVNGILNTSNNITINNSTNSSTSLNIQSSINNIGIWNGCTALANTQYISSFIGKNSTSKNGFYNNYYHFDNNNNNYLSWSAINNPLPTDIILSMTANKYIGIGITNPTALFQISNGGKFKISPNDNDYALIGLSNMDGNSNTKISLVGGINQRIEYYASNGGHIFYTSNGNEKMRINNSGNIGIGTASDLYLLNVNGHIYSSSNIYANSNIGIGNTAPLGNLHIASPAINSDGTLIISKKDNINNRNFKFGYDENFNFTFGDYGTNTDNPLSWKKQFYINSNAPANSLLINTSGNIGIGNTSPLGNLHIATPAINSDGTLIISKKDNINNRNFKFGYDENFNFTFGDYGTNTDNPLSWIKQFYINSNAPENSLMINRLGNIGIGTNNTSLNQKLIVNGNTTINGSIIQLAAGGDPNTFQNAICINTTSPGADNKLNVNGNANIQNLLTTSNLTVTGTGSITKLNGIVKINTDAETLGENVHIWANTRITGNLNVINNIMENNVPIQNTYVKIDNLSNLSINNFNLKKKFGYRNVTSGTTGAIIYNTSNYYKFDIDLRLNTKSLVNTINGNSVSYRSFNIKCFLTDCSFETFNNGLPSILQYDVYMSMNPIQPFCNPPMTTAKTDLNICAIGTPENYKLNNILPSYITLLRNDNPTHRFNYLSIVSPCSNLQVSYIIEDYLS